MTALLHYSTVFTHCVVKIFSLRKQHSTLNKQAKIWLDITVVQIKVITLVNSLLQILLLRVNWQVYSWGCGLNELINLLIIALLKLPCKHRNIKCSQHKLSAKKWSRVLLRLQENIFSFRFVPFYHVKCKSTGIVHYWSNCNIWKWYNDYFLSHRYQSNGWLLNLSWTEHTHIRVTCGVMVSLSVVNTSDPMNPCLQFRLRSLCNFRYVKQLSFPELSLSSWVLVTASLEKYLFIAK